MNQVQHWYRPTSCFTGPGLQQSKWSFCAWDNVDIFQSHPKNDSLNILSAELFSFVSVQVGLILAISTFGISAAQKKSASAFWGSVSKHRIDMKIALSLSKLFCTQNGRMICTIKHGIQIRGCHVAIWVAIWCPMTTCLHLKKKIGFGEFAFPGH